MFNYNYIIILYGGLTGGLRRLPTILYGDGICSLTDPLIVYYCMVFPSNICLL